MDLIQKLSNAPSSIFDWTVECEQEGFIPSRDEFLENFDEKYEDWSYLFPDERIELIGELEDERFLRLEDFMKESGHSIKDFE